MMTDTMNPNLIKIRQRDRLAAAMADAEGDFVGKGSMWLHKADALIARGVRANGDQMENIVARMDFVLSFHNQTPTGLIRECDPGCIACAVRRDYATLIREW